MTSQQAAYCVKCKQSLNDTSDSVVVQFGEQFYHMECRCAKCDSLVEHEANLLLLSDGSPVCEKCSYHCSLCQQPITQEAIVAGDESYCPNCFQCRSCHKAIETLVFAKTSQGIYCMNCHNERVSRSRKHHESKRNRNKASSAKTATAAAAASTTTKTGTPRRSESGPQPSAPASEAVFPASSSSSLEGPPKPIRSSSTPATSTDLQPQRDYAASGPYIKVDSNAGSAESLPTPQSPPALSEHDLARHPPTAPLAPRAPPQIPNPNQTMSAPASNTGFPSNVQASASAAQKRISLMAPASRSANRRSGFYGSHMMPPVRDAEDAITEGDEGDAAPSKSPKARPSLSPRPQNASDAALPTPPLSPSLPSIPSTPSAKQEPMITPPQERMLTPPPKKPTPTKKSALNVPTSPDRPDPSRSLSFYDPDMLTFLEIPSTLDVPKTPKLNEDGDEDEFGSATDQSLPEPEHVSDHELEPEERTEVADQLGSIRQLRESLKPSADGETLISDVKLIDTLIDELEETRAKMKTLQREFNAMKRASTQFMEGINSARDSYEREASLRRRAEEEMSALKRRLYEQAKNTVDLNAAQREERDMERRTSELRTSVYGMEQQLSSLQVERDLTVAELEELSNEHGSEFSTPEQAALSLKARLDELKNAHRAELIDIALQRDELAREVADLARQKDHLGEENMVLEARNIELSASIRDTMKELECAREAIAIQRQPFAGLQGHQKTGSGAPFTTADASPEAVVHAERVATTQPTRKFKWTKGKPAEHKSAPSTTKTQTSAPSSRSASSTDTSIRQHFFQAVSILRPVRCEHCGDKMWGLQEVRCAACGIYCHSKCAPHFHIHCNAAASFVPEEHGVASDLFGGDLSRQAQAENRPIPNIVSACIEAVEEYGMDFEGIYRKTGGMSQVKQISQSFEASSSFSLADGNYDIAAVTSVLKNYFRVLENPLFTFNLHDELVSVAEGSSTDARKLEGIAQALAKLPEAHIATLRLLMNHLHRVHLQSDVNKMTPANLGVVWSPTLLRTDVAGQEFSNINHRARIVELCVEHAPMLFS